MRRRRAIGWIVALELVVRVRAARAEDAAPGTRLARTHDPVVVSTARLASFPTADTAAVRVFRAERGRLVPIRHQFDPRDDGGAVQVDAPREFAFDGDDELVFMASDAGDRAAGVAWPRGCDGAVEVEVGDPRPEHPERAWVYVLHCAARPPAATFEPYVTVDADARRVRSPLYEVEYAPAQNFFTGIRLLQADGTPLDLLRRTRMRGSPTFALPFRDVTIEFTEQNTIVHVDGVRAGPVRVVRRARLSIDLGRFFPSLPGGTAYTYHYRTAFLTPSRIGFSWLVLKALRAFRFESLHDFLPAALPFTYFDRAHPDGLRLPADPSTATVAAGDHEWWAHSHRAGTMLHAFVIPERWRAWGIERGTVLRPEPASAGEPATWAAGYTLEHMMQLQEAGTWDLLQASVVLPRAFRAGDEVEPLLLVQAPLTAAVHRLW